MDKLVLTSLGGIPIVNDDFREFLGQAIAGSDAIYQAFDQYNKDFGSDYIVQGCVVTGTNPNKTMTEGWIVLNNEFMKVDAIAGTLDDSVDNTFTKDISFKAEGNKTLLNGAFADTYQKNRGILNGTGGTLAVASEPLMTFTGAILRDTANVETRGKIITLIVDLGDWDMDLDQTLNRSHGVANFKRIRSVEAIIRDDSDNLYSPLAMFDTISEVVNGGINDINVVNIILVRLTGGFFDAIGYDATPFNRGFMKITYQLP